MNKATKDGLHIRCANKRVQRPEEPGSNYVVYDLYDGNAHLVSAYGAMAIMSLGIIADKLDDDRKFKGSTRIGLDWLLEDEVNEDDGRNEALRQDIFRQQDHDHSMNG